MCFFPQTGDSHSPKCSTTMFERENIKLRIWSYLLHKHKRSDMVGVPELLGSSSVFSPFQIGVASRLVNSVLPKKKTHPTGAPRRLWLRHHVRHPLPGGDLLLRARSLLRLPDLQVRLQRRLAGR